MSANDLLLMLGAGLGLVVAVVLALAWHVRFWKRRLGLVMPYDELEIVATEDGARFELRRIAPRCARVGEPPVLLVHGIAANHRNHDMHPDHSLARFLAAAGRDVWLLTLRSALPPRSSGERALVTFARMARHDVPEAVGRVLARTGAAALDYVGFSMGGMLLYASLGRALPVDRLRRVVIVGSPGRVASPLPLPSVLRHLPSALVPSLPLGLGARTAAFASEWLVTPVHRLVVNPANVPPGLVRVALVDVIEDVPARLCADFKEWLFAGGEVRVDGAPVLAGLAGVQIPALFFAGEGDKVAPVAAVRHAFDAWGAERSGVSKRFVVLGRSTGARADYGHGDLAVGTHVTAELFPMVEAFLDAPELVAPEDAVRRSAAGPSDPAPPSP